MNRFVLVVMFGLLAVTLSLLWLNRFEAIPGHPGLVLGDLRNGAVSSEGVRWNDSASGAMLTLQVPADGKPVVTRMSFPGIDAVDFLMLKIRLTGVGLVPGSEPWNDGRSISEWWQPEGMAPEMDPVNSVSADHDTEVEEVVMRPERTPAIPVLRLENSGTAGTLEVRHFEAVPLRERLMWRVGRWIIMAAWLLWAVAWIGPQINRRHLSRAFAAAAIWLVMMIYAVVPGPWKEVRPLWFSFHVPAGVAAERPERPVFSRTLPDGLPVAVGKIPDKGDITLRIKHQVKNARSLLHVLMLLGPTFLLAMLVGRKPACSLGIILSIGTEVAEYAFDFGFDWLDVFDLACDGAGIALALVWSARVLRMWEKRFAVRELAKAAAGAGAA